MIVAIVGPTGIGKTALSIALAKYFQAEIINFDSMQVYQKLDIGTAKVTLKEMENINHHLLSYVPLDQNYSVYDYQKDGRAILDRLLQEGKNVILVGGTGLYLKALLYDYRFCKETEVLTYDDFTTEALVEKIASYAYAGVYDPHNRKRLVRLLNKLEHHEPVDTNGNRPLYDFQVIGLTCDRDQLYKRLDLRVDQMFQNGLEKEIDLVKDSFNTAKALQTGIGYKEFIPYLQGQCSLEEVKGAIKKNSRRYAKRQFTFFKHQFHTKWYDVNFDDFQSTVQKVIEDLSK